MGLDQTVHHRLGACSGPVLSDSARVSLGSVARTVHHRLGACSGPVLSDSARVSLMEC